MALTRVLSRRLVVTALVIVGFLAATAYLLDWLAATGGGAAGTGPGPRQEPGPLASAGPGLAETGLAQIDVVPTKQPPVLTLPGDFPADGPGTFRFASGEGEVLGESGPLRRFRLAVEDGVDEDLADLTGFVDDTLGHRRGWTAEGEIRLQRVPDGAGHDFTIYLATSGTTARRCAAGGLDVIGFGLPEGGVSCRLTGQVVLNLYRWRLSVAEYVDQRVPLETYRQMLLNHEVGHELGYGHQACPGQGEPAPVMQQQTLRLDGCEPNPWPYLDGRFHTGPPVP